MKRNAVENMLVPLLGTKDLIGKNGKSLSLAIRTLLRRQHKTIRKMISKAPECYRLTDGTIPPILYLMKAELLYELDKMREGGRERV